MNIFNLSNNNINRKISQLSYDKKLAFSIINTSYNYFRKHIQDEFLLPFLKHTFSDNKNAKLSELKEIIIDETLLSVLKSSQFQSYIKNDRLKFYTIPEFINIIGVLTVADFNFHTSSRDLRTLDDVSYSNIPDEARTQLIVKIASILDITDPSLIKSLNSINFIKPWNDLSDALISGVLSKLDTIEVDLILNMNNKLIKKISKYQQTYFEFIIDNLNEKKSALSESKVRLFNKSGNVSGSVTYQTGNKKEIYIPEKSDGLSLFQGIFIHSGDMMPNYQKELFSSWAGLPINSWDNRHREFFSLAYIVHIFTASENGLKLPEVFSNLLNLYPDIKLPILEKELTKEIRELFNSLVGE